MSTPAGPAPRLSYRGKGILRPTQPAIERAGPSWLLATDGHVDAGGIPRSRSTVAFHNDLRAMGTASSGLTALHSTGELPADLAAQAAHTRAPHQARKPTSRSGSLSQLGVKLPSVRGAALPPDASGQAIPVPSDAPPGKAPPAPPAEVAGKSATDPVGPSSMARLLGSPLPVGPEAPRPPAGASARPGSSVRDTPGRNSQSVCSRDNSFLMSRGGALFLLANTEQRF